MDVSEQLFQLAVTRNGPTTDLALASPVCFDVFVRDQVERVVPNALRRSRFASNQRVGGNTLDLLGAAAPRQICAELNVPPGHSPAEI